MTDLILLATIKLYYPHPYRLFYTRCWGCKKRRVFGDWWEGYQMDEETNCWGYFCSSCIVIVCSMVNDRLHAQIAASSMEMDDEIMVATVPIVGQARCKRCVTMKDDCTLCEKCWVWVCKEDLPGHRCS